MQWGYILIISILLFWCYCPGWPRPAGSTIYISYILELRYHRSLRALADKFELFDVSYYIYQLVIMEIKSTSWVGFQHPYHSISIFFGSWEPRMLVYWCRTGYLYPASTNNLSQAQDAALIIQANENSTILLSHNISGSLSERDGVCMMLHCNIYNKTHFSIVRIQGRIDKLVPVLHIVRILKGGSLVW